MLHSLRLCHSTRVPLIVIRKWGRKHFTDLDGKKVLALPLIDFIDGFGLYRNSYRSLMGIYLIARGFKPSQVLHDDGRHTGVDGPLVPALAAPESLGAL